MDVKIRKYGMIRRRLNLVWKTSVCLTMSGTWQVRDDVEVTDGEDTILEYIKAMEYDAFEDLKDK